MKSHSSQFLLAALLACISTDALAQRVFPVVDTNGVLLSPSSFKFGSANGIAIYGTTNSFLPDEKLREIVDGGLFHPTVINRNTNGVMTNAIVQWSDFTYGTLTTLVINTNGHDVDSFQVTYTNRNKLITQPVVLRNSNGDVTNAPALTIQ